MNTTIKKITSLEILDSRGNPTVKTTVHLEDGSKGVCSVPSGASTGKFEAVELRDGGKRYFGKGVTTAVRNVEKRISEVLIGKDARNQKEVDQAMFDIDGTENKSELGANAILSVSVACAKASANAMGIDLFRYFHSLTPGADYRMPSPMFNIMNGGAHADNNLSIQEFMIVPIGVDGLSERLRAAAEITYTLKSIIKKRGGSTGIGDEGGFAPQAVNDEQALDLIVEAISGAGYEGRVKIAIDVAISQYWDSDDEIYAVPGVKFGENLVGKAPEIVKFYEGLMEVYPIISIEDGLDENDWEGWKVMQTKFGSKVMNVGDDFTVTNPKRLQKAIDEKCINAMILKPNQIGSITEVIEVVKICKENDIKIIASHRSGETSDTSIVDLAIGIGAEFCKFGAPVRGERVAKYNRMLEIEKVLENGINRK